ncbi:MAG: nitronate monooxygenase [Armatimonadetes bacterium]|nr:nitronate monooxygenase [Armatimonadota bacterium]
MNYPQIIQGGMGVGISGWRLAQAVASAGQLGVVSSTALDTVLVRRLQLGDPGGHMRLALDAFPIVKIAQEVWDKYYVSGGKDLHAPFKSKPMPSLKQNRALADLVVLANFVEVYLARLGHQGLVGINLMEKIQLPTLPSLFGALLAGVDYVLMGAGIPRFVPGALDRLAEGERAELPIYVANAPKDEAFYSRFDPAAYLSSGSVNLRRPKFLAIVASSPIAATLAKKSSGRVDGFVVEGPRAGGHNAPPRGPMVLGETGEPVYGERDVPDLNAIKDLGLPFWLAGSYGRPGMLSRALDLGATGIQVGTAFAFCEESGMAPSIRERVLSRARQKNAQVFTNALASPTGFPFKVLAAEGSLSEEAVYGGRARVCDLGYLRAPYLREDGTIGYRCPAEPEKDFAEKGGNADECACRMCLCNGLMATAGFPQARKDGSLEPPLVTAGDEVVNLKDFLQDGKNGYTARDVVECLLGG